MMESEAAAEAYSPPDQDEDTGMNGAEEQEVEGDTNAPMGQEEEEEWTCVDSPQPQSSIRYFTPHFRLLPSPGPLAEEGQRLALSVSSITGRFWRGAVALAAIPDSSSEPLLDLEAVCELPSGVCDLRFLGQRSDRLITGHDDGCVSVLALEKAESGSKLQPVSFAVEHDSLVRRVSVARDGDLAASIELGGRVRLWMLEPFLSTHSFSAFSFDGSDLSLHPNRRQLLAACGNSFGAPRQRGLALWDLRSADSGAVAKPHGGVASSEDGAAFSALAWSPADDDWLFAGDHAGHVSLFDLRSLKEPLATRRRLHGGCAVERLAAQGARVLSTALDRRLVTSEVRAEDGGLAKLREAPGSVFTHAASPQGLAVSADGERSWSCDLAGAVWLHTAGKESRKCRLHPPLHEIQF